jgi:hypothetical protein
MDNYDESYIKEEPLCDSILKRPGMYLGDIDNGEAYALIVQLAVDLALRWQVGSDLQLELLPENKINLTCRIAPPGDPRQFTMDRFRPLQIGLDGKPAITPRWMGLPGPQIVSCVCRLLHIEIRDSSESIAATFCEGECINDSTDNSSLPKEFCLRISMNIGTQRLPIVPATLEQVVDRICHMGGPPDAEYWGRIAVSDVRVDTTRNVVVTDYPHLSKPA